MPPAYEVLLLNTAIPQIQAAQTGDTYVVPRDIAFSAALTLSAGTANGVPYLNGSKVVTTGSALTFDGSEIFKNSGGTIQNNDVRGSAAAGTRLSAGGTLGVDSFDLFQNAVGGYVFNRGNTPLIFGANNTERARITSTGEFQWKPDGTTQAMTLDASGKLGVGETSPAAVIHANAAGGGSIRASRSTVSSEYIQMDHDGSNGSLRVSGAYAMLFHTNSAERARITSAGEVLFGLNAQTNTPANGFVFQNLGTTSSQVLIGHSNGSGSGTYYEAYFYDSTVIGSVTQNGTTGVLYNITSDYRLKTVTGPVTDAGSRIDALEPVEYTWKANGSSARGFLAHKFQEVYPNSVTGQKDAIDAEGNPVYQNMQASTSEVIADLVAELQSLRSRVAQLEAK